MLKDFRVKRKNTNKSNINSVENIGKYKEHENHPQCHHPEKGSFGDTWFSFLI